VATGSNPQELHKIFEGGEHDNLRCEFHTTSVYKNDKILSASKVKPEFRNPRCIEKFAEHYTIAKHANQCKELNKKQEVTLLSETVFCKGTATCCAVDANSLPAFNKRFQSKCRYAVSWFVTADANELKSAAEGKQYIYIKSAESSLSLLKTMKYYVYSYGNHGATWKSLKQNPTSRPLSTKVRDALRKLVKEDPFAKPFTIASQARSICPEIDYCNAKKVEEYINNRKRDEINPLGLDDVANVELLLDKLSKFIIDSNAYFFYLFTLGPATSNTTMEAPEATVDSAAPAVPTGKS
jgi:hypothetical protein